MPITVGDHQLCAAGNPTGKRLHKGILCGAISKSFSHTAAAHRQNRAASDLRRSGVIQATVTGVTWAVDDHRAAIHIQITVGIHTVSPGVNGQSPAADAQVNIAVTKLIPIKSPGLIRATGSIQAVVRSHNGYFAISDSDAVAFQPLIASGHCHGAPGDGQRLIGMHPVVPGSQRKDTAGDVHAAIAMQRIVGTVQCKLPAGNLQGSLRLNAVESGMNSKRSTLNGNISILCIGLYSIATGLNGQIGG